MESRVTGVRDFSRSFFFWFNHRSDYRVKSKFIIGVTGWPRFLDLPRRSKRPPHYYIITTTFFRPQTYNITESFDYLEDPVSVTTSLVRQGFYGPTVVALTGSNEISCKEDKAKFNTHAPALSLKIIFAASLLKLYIWSKRTRQICGFCTSRTWWCRSQQLSFHLFFWKMKSNNQSV